MHMNSLLAIPHNKLLWITSLKRRGSTKRRKSVLLGLDMDDDSSSGDESFRGTVVIN